MGKWMIAWWCDLSAMLSFQTSVIPFITRSTCRVQSLGGGHFSNEIHNNLQVYDGHTYVCLYTLYILICKFMLGIHVCVCESIVKCPDQWVVLISVVSWSLRCPDWWGVLINEASWSMRSPDKWGVLINEVSWSLRCPDWWGVLISSDRKCTPNHNTYLVICCLASGNDLWLQESSTDLHVQLSVSLMQVYCNAIHFVQSNCHGSVLEWGVIIPSASAWKLLHGT